jgi:hypothetical protein
VDEVEVTAKGPVFDGRAKAALAAFERAAEDAVADYGVTAVRETLHGVLRNPTGHYESTIHSDRSGPNAEVLDGTIYGPWLEGTGSRNHTTRFKGYATFRRTTQKIQARAAEIAERHLPPYLRRMN